MPDGFLRAVAGSSCPPPGAYAGGIAFLPADADAAAPRGRDRRGHRRRGGPDRARLARRADRRRVGIGPTARGVMPRVPTGLPGRRRPARPGSTLERLAFGAPQGRRAARARERARAVLPVAVVPHDGLQGHAHDRPARRVLPRPAPTSGSPARSAWCTAGSRPTRSRPGRWRTRSATSRTTARSTRSAATATGCAPARRCSSPT